MKNNKVNFFNLLSKENIPMIASSLFLTFTFFVSGTLQMLMSNAGELWFSISETIIPIIVSFVISAMILIIIGLFLKEKYKTLYSCLIFGIGLGLYIQGNFIQTEYGVLNGNDVNWDNYTIEPYVNTAIWIVCLLLPFALHYMKNKLLEPFLFFVSFGIIMMQMVALLSLTFTTNFQIDSGFYPSIKGMHEISDGENVLVFVLDTFDYDILEEIIENDPEFLDPLDGFTNYKNTTGVYPTTKGALPYLMTGQYYKNEKPYDTYVNEAFYSTEFYSSLKDKGYDIGLYTAKTYLSEPFANEFLTNAANGEMKISSHFELLKRILEIATSSHFPHILKPYIWPQNYSFDDIKTVESNMEESYNNANDARYFYDLKQNGLSINNSRSTYRLIHLLSPHPPFTYGENFEPLTENEATRLTEAKAALNYTFEYLNELKRLGVYDNSTIVITADHGITYDLFTSPIFLVKEKHSSGEIITSNLIVSHSDLLPTIAMDIGFEISVEDGIPIQLNNDGIIRSRKYFDYALEDSENNGYLPNLTEYEINNEKDYFPTGNQYIEGETKSIDLSYNLGQILNLGDHNARKYFIKGLSGPESSHSWAYGNESLFSIQIRDAEKINTDLAVSFEIPLVNGEQTVQIYSVNDDEETKIFDSIVTATTLSVLVPNKHITDGRLDLRFYYPDAISPLELGLNNDVRVISIAFHSVVIEEYIDQQLTPTKLELLSIYDQLSISFNVDNEYKRNKYTIIENWNAQESNGLWTSKDSSFTFKTESNEKDIETIWTYNHLVNEVTTEIWLNGEKVDNLIYDDSNTSKIILPKELLTTNGLQKISILTPSAKSPNEISNSTDSRTLGVFVKQIDFNTLLE